MHFFAIAILIGIPVLTSAGFSQDNSSSTTPSSASRPADSAADSQAPSSGPLGSGPAPRVCGEKKDSDCAKAPRLIKSAEPKYAKEAKEKKIEGTVVLMLIVGADGLPRDIRVNRSLGHGLDKEAIKAVKKWKFKPGTVHGHPIPMLINVEVNFRLH